MHDKIKKGILVEKESEKKVLLNGCYLKNLEEGGKKKKPPTRLSGNSFYLTKNFLGLKKGRRVLESRGACGCHCKPSHGGKNKQATDL